MNNISFLLILSFAFAFDFILSQTQECWCGDFCSAVQSHDLIVQGKVKKVVDNGTVVKYRIQINSNLKGKTKKHLWVSALSDDPCLITLQKKKTYLLFLIEQNREHWLSSCFNDEWAEEYRTRVRKCFDCPLVKCRPCTTGFEVDENGCRTCVCKPCPNGEHPVECLVAPCSSQDTECPQAHSCVDDYCGGCHAHYFDASGNEICKKCDDVMCTLFCEYGFKTDENGCEICECNECPHGEPPVQCKVRPCSLQETECPDAAKCVDDYCGGCNAHYFDRNGNEICNQCPDVMCAMFCEYGFKKDKNGCDMCECNLCPNGDRPVNCFVRPCALQATHCPEAATCVDDYCGGCFAHYFDKEGNEICV